MKIAVGIPTLNNISGLQSLIHSIYLQDNVEVDLYLVANGREVEDQCRRWDDLGAKVFFPGDNLGLAQSWNHMASSAFLNGHQQIIFLHDDVELKSDSILCTYRWADMLWKGRILFESGPHAFSLPKTVYLGVGQFDKGFWPHGPWPFNDYLRRCHLWKSMERKLTEANPDDPNNEWDGKQELDALRLAMPTLIHHGMGSACSKMQKLIEQTHRLNQERYLLKWGGLPGKETAPLPWAKLDPSPSTREIYFQASSGPL